MKGIRGLMHSCLLCIFLLNTLLPQTAVFAAGTVLQIVVCQAGYAARDVKIAYAIAGDELADRTYQVYRGATQVSTGTMADEGVVWGKRVYSIDFSSVTETGTSFTVKSNGISSYGFSIQANNWADYRKDMMAYYRMQRAGTDTAVLMTQGDYKTYADNPLVSKGFHPASHLDDAWDPTKTKHYDLTGGWYDAGDYGIYSENQWVIGQMALSYLDNMSSSGSSEVDFDYDKNGVPDVLDEIIFGATFALKMVDAFDGLGYNVMRYMNTNADDKGGWKHPEKYTDNKIYDGASLPNDDRFAYPESKSVEGSVKLAASLTASARALLAAKAAGKITDAQLANFKYDQKNKGVNLGDIDNNGNIIPGHTAPVPMDLIDACIDRAVVAYNAAKAYDGKNIGEYPRSNYLATNGLRDPLLWAEVELYLLNPVKNQSYLDRAKQRINLLTFNDLRCTSYWSVSSLALAELYPAVASSDTVLASRIQSLLESRVNYFITSANDTPYGVLNEFSDFGVNEPHVSYVADTLRYYKLFKDKNPALAAKALKAVKKGLYWVFGNNPWNTSWVSGIGSNYTKFLHSRLDEEAQSVDPALQKGLILPGAMACGANLVNPMDKNSVNPWYQDIPVKVDGANQWRYNEHSISIQIGLFYSILSLSTLKDTLPVTGEEIRDTVILSPKTGDKVDKGTNGMVRITALPRANNVQIIEYAMGSETGVYVPMAKSGGLYTADLDISGANPLSAKRVILRTTFSDGTVSYSSTHFVIAPSFPSYQQDLLIDDFNGNGAYAGPWVCWWGDPKGPDGKTAKIDPGDGRKVLQLTQDTPKSPTNAAQFRNQNAFPDMTGYRYLYVTLRNAGTNPNMQVRITFDNKPSPWVTYPPSNDYQTIVVDMDAIFGPGAPHTIKDQFNIQVRSNADPNGECLPTKVYVKEIKVGNKGTPPSFTFSNCFVDKASGDENTVFNFGTTLTIDQSVKPFGVQVVIDGVIRDMLEVDRSDTNFKDGKDYTYSTRLTRGEHSYYFRTNDSRSPVQTGLLVTPPSEVVAAIQAIAALPTVEQLTLADKNAVVTARGMVEAAKLKGAVDVDITNLALLAAAESRIAYLEALPGVFELIGPANAAINQQTNPVLTWSTSAKADSYLLTVSTSPDFSNPIYNESVGNATYRQITGLTNLTTYYWKVVAGNPVGKTPAANNGFSFTTVIAAPGSFTLLSPENGEKKTSTQPTLRWSGSERASSYTLTISANSDFSNPVFNKDVGNTTSWQVTGLDYGVTYYWKVTANNAGGSTPASGKGFYFTTDKKDRKEEEEKEKEKEQKKDEKQEEKQNGKVGSI